MWVPMSEVSLGLQCTRSHLSYLTWDCLSPTIGVLGRLYPFVAYHLICLIVDACFGYWIEIYIVVLDYFDFVAGDIYIVFILKRYAQCHVTVDISAAWMGLRILTVMDKGEKECVDPEGNGVTMNEGTEGGPGPPSRECDKQSAHSSGSGKTSVGELEEQEDGLGATSRPLYAQSMYCVRINLL
jgi:hypothetical protein